MNADIVTPNNFETYISLLKQGDSRACLLQILRSNYTYRCRFDQASGNQLPQSTHEFAKADIPLDESRDYLWYIVSNSLAAFRNITDNLRTNIQRNHVLLPAYSAREMDTKSAIWLSRQPGRNIREKLNHSGRILAVQRHFSSDTVENRLLKAFAMRLNRCLILYMEICGEAAPQCMAEMLQLTSRWLRSEVAAEISPWQHVPPNNALLQHKFYRKIWDSWMRLQRMNEVIAHDFEHLSSHFFFNMGWNIVRRLREYCDFRLLQQPLQTNYEFIAQHAELTLRGWVPTCPDESFQALPISIEIKHQGLTIQVGRYQRISVCLSEDGMVCRLPDGSEEANIWSLDKTAIIEDTTFNALVNSDPTPMLEFLTRVEPELSHYLRSGGLPATLNTHEAKFNQLYSELISNPGENIAYRLNAAYQEHGSLVFLQGLRELLNLQDLPTHAEQLLWDIVYKITELSEWANYCSISEHNHNRADSFKMLGALLDDKEHQVWYGDFLRERAEQTQATALYGKAYYWYLRAAEDDNVWAFYNLGNCWENGLGCPQNLQQAIEYYTRSDTHLGCFRIGCIYEQDKDFKLAEQWFMKAKEKGNHDAKKKLQKVRSNMGIKAWFKSKLK